MKKDISIRKIKNLKVRRSFWDRVSSSLVLVGIIISTVASYFLFGEIEFFLERNFSYCLKFHDQSRTLVFYSVYLCMLYVIIIWPVKNFPYDGIYNRIMYTLDDLASLKSSLYGEYHYLVKLIEKDTIGKWIDNVLVVDIKKAVQNIKETIQEYPTVFKRIQKQRKYFFIFFRSIDFISSVNTLVKTEKQELVDSIRNIQKDIQSWTALHQKELLEIERELETQVATTENLSGQWALDLQRVRLHEHIENLNTVTNTL